MSERAGGSAEAAAAERPGRAPIAVLPPEVAERVAAGEVVERPSSVVRELLDNALDAGATAIVVEVRGGGIELIRVGDDGVGIPADQVGLAFQRHATSKIGAVEDIFRLTTLGFRGEALPSIAAVAEVALVTRTADAPAATSIVVRASQILRQGRAARQPGTTVTVRHLFHNLPARLTFLPTGRAESLLVGQMVRRYALAHPRVRFTLIVDGHTSFRSSGAGSLVTVVAEVYGQEVAAAAHAIARQAIGGATVHGLLGGRTHTRPSRQHLHLVVNGRLAASRGLVSALDAAYRPFLPRGRHPIGVLVLEVPPAELDPNVHPAKTEVRLVREAEIAAGLADLVRATFGHAPAEPAASEALALVGGQLRLPMPRRRLAESRGPDWDADDAPIGAVLPALQIVAQVRAALILAEGPGGLYLIDQHRAHERIIYQRLRQTASSGEDQSRLDPGQSGATIGQRRNLAGAGEAQILLEPIVLALTAPQADQLDTRLPELAALGFTCQRFGRQDYLVRAVPPEPALGESLVPQLGAILEEAAVPDEGWRERLLISLACRSAVRRGRALGEAAMRDLLRDLAATDAPAVCPHGSPLVLRLSGRFLERQLGW